MLSLYLVLFSTGLAFIWALRKQTTKNEKLPPGPVGIPILGYLPFLNIFDLGKSFTKLSQKFGDIFSIRVGTEMAVVLNNEELIRKAFAKQEMCSRPNTFMFRFFSRGQHGIASASGERWEIQRRFTHKNLKRLGFGTPKMEGFVHDAVDDLIQNLNKKSSTAKAPIEVGFDVNASVVSVIWSLISGERRSSTDSTIRSLLKAINKSIAIASTSGILLFMPFLIKILPEWLFGIDKLRKWMKESDKFLGKVIAEHKERLAGELETDENGNFVTESEDDQDRDFIDSFLREMQKGEKCHKSFTDFQLLVLCTELFGAGGEPTSVTLKWALRFLAANPHVQKKVQEEIERVVGADRKVTLQDKVNMPYMQALVYEVIRLADIHPIGVLHSPTKDTEIDGYVIPKGAFVFANFQKCLRNPEDWERPNELYPEHWLDSQGNFTGGKHPGFISFSAGKRKCPGEEVALMEIFLFLSNLIQSFKFRLPEGDDGSRKQLPGIVTSPKPYSLILESRYG